MINFEVNYGKLRGGARLPRQSWLALSRSLKKLFPKSGTWLVSVAFLSKAQMRKINKQYRGQDKPTDVLSFKHDERGLLGEILICYPIAKEQAQQNHLSVRQELFRLLVHGLLHLMGYQHSTDLQAKEMFTLQELILKQSKI